MASTVPVVEPSFPYYNRFGPIPRSRIMASAAKEGGLNERFTMHGHIGSSQMSLLVAVCQCLELGPFVRICMSNFIVVHFLKSNLVIYLQITEPIS